MICARCAYESTPTDVCGRCAQTPLLRSPAGVVYRLEQIIGEGASGISYRATRLHDDAVVCIKELPFHRLSSFKAEELFRREARILRQLDHPSIPAYVDDFICGEGKALSLYLVQEFVDGITLEHEAKDKRYTEPEVWAIVAELASILDYLHNLHPPVIHRDLKPTNIMRRKGTGELVLIDFGSVKDAVYDVAAGGSTIAGTYGYMPPEQFYGKALCAISVSTVFLRESHILVENYSVAHQDAKARAIKAEQQKREFEE